MIFRPATGGQIFLMTAIAGGILLAIGTFFLVLGYNLRDRGSAHYVFYFSGALLLLLLVASLSFRIRYYQIDSGNLIVKIGLSEKVFPLQNLEQARLEESPFFGCRRDMGVGGLWSNCGLFTSPRWGQFHAYASDTARGVLLIWPEVKVLVTPADPTLFIQSVKTPR